MFSSEDLVKLRKRTNAGILDCKKALDANNGDLDKATEWLREKGIAAVAKKADRIAAEGLVYSYIHMGGKIGVLLEINCETDFVSRSEKFVELCKNISMHIAAAKPEFINIADVPTERVEHEKEILTAQSLNEGKPENVIAKMVEGRVKKFYKEICLLEQEYVKDPSKTINDIVTDATLTIGEKISIRRFTRYEMGEGLEKRVDNFVEEVLKQSQSNN